MMQSPFFPQTTGLTPATEAASLPGGVQSQLGVQTLLPPIPSSASVSSQPSPPETAARATEEKSTEEETDSDLHERAADVFKSIFGQEPNRSMFDLQLPTCSIDKLCLYQAFKAQLLSLADSDPHRESAQRGADALLLIAKALQEARTTRLQGRFGFRMAEQMKSENVTGLLTERQEQILKETRLATSSSNPVKV
eukprot:MONOS_14594.1-p1 / transcript=MONOS_14594.1 / gene=MONOS_14594 / organism=Monocercomonoides_exilis_PA203 / gene_product=unspecified product / transcript_product=unspecified product / location=Mono_scaffold01031:1-703(-) / protein_length=194 / sequence_SO=supercontig / SO=protein_coding / is_pseudo=false